METQAAKYVNWLNSKVYRWQIPNNKLAVKKKKNLSISKTFNIQPDERFAGNKTHKNCNDMLDMLLLSSKQQSHTQNYRLFWHNNVDIV